MGGNFDLGLAPNKSLGFISDWDCIDLIEGIFEILLWTLNLASDIDNLLCFLNDDFEKELGCYFSLKSV